MADGDTRTSVSTPCCITIYPLTEVDVVPLREDVYDHLYVRVGNKLIGRFIKNNWLILSAVTLCFGLCLELSLWVDVSLMLFLPPVVLGGYVYAQLQLMLHVDYADLTADSKFWSKWGESSVNYSMWIGKADGGEIVGCCTITNMGQNTCQLGRVLIYPKFQRRGFGRDIVQHALKQSKLLGYKRILVSTTGVQYSARKLYESLGFHLIKSESFWNGALHLDTPSLDMQ